MLFKNRIDDFDDYKKEQEEISREKNYSSSSDSTNKKKNRKFVSGKTINSDGTISYNPSVNGNQFIWYYVIMIAFMIFVFGTCFLNKASFDSENFIAILPMLVILMIFCLIVFFLRRGSNIPKEIILKDNEIDIVKRRNTITTYRYSDFVNVEHRRNYGKNSSYTGTTYFLVFRTSDGKTTKYGFGTRTHYVVSDLVYEIKRRQRLEKSGFDSNNRMDIAFSEATFDFSMSDSKQIDRMRKILPFVVIAPLMIMMFVTIALNSSSFYASDSFVIPFMMILVFILIAIILALSIKSNESMNIESFRALSDRLIINNSTYLASEVKSVIITPNRVNNPLFLQNSTLELVVDDKVITYKIGVFFSDRRMLFNSQAKGIEWPYDKFYSCIKTWSEVNDIRCVDLII